ncbi:zinc finger protein 704 [Folsomia candida]|uniref:SLC2A4 regulator n=1 Tax=Folsomia candida TaxID=158441 RepID=A0A226EL33_FOLCA|nr:zinc finger protein 704 [Folsomia candida]XP_035706502.1 zinc finger protein 704 [Folsomia candida]OXA58169.1 SLC2A4 regulator [Folsomia candida]
MSAGKRLAKRSIVGTRICAPMRETSQYSPGVIIGSKNPDELHCFNNCHTGITPNSKYVVRFETGETREFSESELVGPGFGNVSSLKLRTGQKVFVTHNGREISGNVVYHRPQIDEVLINIPPTPGSNEIPFDVTKKLDEVRLLESRKSARLQEQDFDFARLVADRKRNQQTASIDVPRSSTMSRKRRPSSGSLFQPVMLQAGGDGEMDECAAALVLMSLHSGSPKSPHWVDNNVGMISSSWSSSSSSGASSWFGSASNQSVVGSLGAVSSPGELHFNSNSPTPSSSDEGVESDIGDWEEPRRKRKKIFKCTFPGCTMIKERCLDIEGHVRAAHLGGNQSSADDREEEFYYTEIEVSLDLPSSPASFGGSSSNGLGMAFSPTMSHMDMARPWSQDPEYKLNQQQLQLQHHQRKSPSGNTHLNPKKRASPKSSPVRRPRGDTKKCRKVYGMERRENWCTQCRWKKACTRFGD